MRPSSEHLHRLLSSDHVTPATKTVLEARTSAEVSPYQFLTAAEGALLEAVSVCLVPHDPVQLPLAREIDARLQRGDTDGWRYDQAAPDGEAYRQLLASLPAGFQNTSAEAQNAALKQAQQDQPLVFEDLLAELTEIFYSQPEEQVGIGYVGFADAQGWQQIGLNQLDDHERDALHLLARDDS
jgi:gluconate 2-dehydrogenase gamma chain